MSGRRHPGTGLPGIGTKAHRIRIGQRDGWFCGICWQPIDPDLSVYESIWASVVDHKQPKWAGGTHEDDNLQIAHYECNRIKGKEVLSSLHRSDTDRTTDRITDPDATGEAITREAA